MKSHAPFFTTLFLLISLSLGAQTPTEFHWQHLGALPEFGKMNFLQIHNGNTLVAMTRDGYAKPKLAYSTDFGKTWQQSDLPSLDWTWAQLFSVENRLVVIPCFSCQPTQYVSTDLGHTWTEYDDRIEGVEGYLNYLDHNTRYTKFGYHHAIYEWIDGRWQQAYAGDAESQWSAPVVAIGRKDIEFCSVENGPFYNIRYNTQGGRGYFTGKVGAPVYCVKNSMVQSVRGYYNTRNSIWISKDMGANWTIAYESPADITAGALVLEQMFRVCENGRLFGDFTSGVRDNEGKLYEVPDFCFSNDEGRKWISLGAPGGKHTSQILFMTDGSLLVVTADNAIYKSSLAIGCTYDAAGTNCILPTFDKGKPTIIADGGGFVVEGSEDFVKLVGRALVRLKAVAPDYYDKYIHSATYDGLKGIKIECEIGVNHPDEAMFIRLVIKDLTAYKRFDDCIDLLASVILHEAVHVNQVYRFRLQTGGSFRDFCQYNRSDIAIARANEHECLAMEMHYLDKVYKTSLCQAQLRRRWCWLTDLYNSGYPDADDDGKFDSKDNAEWAGGAHPKVEEPACPDIKWNPDDGTLIKPAIVEQPPPVQTKMAVKQQTETTTAPPAGTKPVTSSTPGGVLNGTFENSQYWSATGGTAEFENGMATIKPSKTKEPVFLRQQPFRVPDDAKTLTLKLDKGAIGNGEFKIIVKEPATGNSEVIYTERINKSATKVADGLGKVNKALETGEISEWKRKENLEPVSADISAFRGKVVVLELSFEALGLFKPKVSIDDVTITN